MRSEFIRPPDSAGFGDCTGSGIVIPLWLDGEHVNVTAWSGPARSVQGGLRFIADLPLPWGRLLHDDREVVARGVK